MNEHKKQLSYYAAIGLEMIVSGYFNEMNFFWWITRLWIIGVIYSAIETKKTLVLRFAPLIFVFLSLSGIREKWHSIAESKLAKQEKVHTTNIVKPEKPILPNCENETKWRKELCESKSEKLQLAYAGALEKYNSRIQKSENDIRKIEIELSLYDQQPIWIYVFLSMACIALTILTTFEENKIENEIVIQEETAEEKESRIKAEIIRRLLLKESKLSIAKIYGKTWRNIRDIENELFGRKHNVSTMNAQSEKVVSIREIKRGA